MKKWLRFVFSLMVCSLMWTTSSMANEELLSPERAFQVQIQDASKSRIHLKFKIAPGYYLYHNKFQFQLSTASIDVPVIKALSVKLPVAHERKFDETFQKTLEMYRGTVDIELPLPADMHQYRRLVVHYQGCTDHGVCYPPIQTLFDLDKAMNMANLEKNKPLSSQVTNEASQAEGSGLVALWGARDDANQLKELLEQLPIPYLMLGLLLLGIALCFTPCVLPMVPIISAIILEPVSGTSSSWVDSRWRGLILSSVYVLGMAITYTLVGVLTALLGASLIAYLQNPWVLAGFAVLLLWMACSLFGWWALRVPVWLSVILDKVLRHSHSKKGVWGAVLMGMLSAVLAGSCMTPPLAGILLMIAHTGSPLTGGLLLFSLALGIGLPLILFGAGAGHWVPRTGSWMNWVKYFFGVALVLLALWFIWPLSLKIYHHFYPFENKDEASALSLEKRSPFIRVHNVNELEHYLATAGKPIMLDFYAEWCVSCHEMEQFTLSDPDIRRRLQNVMWLQVDVTENLPEHQQLMKRFALFGPPAIIFFDASGLERRYARVIGYQPIAQFQRTLDKALSAI